MSIQNTPLLKFESHQALGEEEEKQGRHDLFEVAKNEKEESQSESSNDDEGQEHNQENEPADFITAQYEKVQRTKQKYKCMFKDVIIHINGKDYVLKRINADIEY